MMARMRMLPLLAFAACSNAEPERELRFDVTGRLEDATIREASGLARSHRQPDTLWLINDNGARETVHAIDQNGARLGEFDLKKSSNKDWEDLASFRLDDEAYLMIADIGDNDARRKHRTLYFVAEPESERQSAAITAWKQVFTYPDGARDSESAAVDVSRQRALILSKRDLPPRLYELPLRTDSDRPVAAVLLGNVESLDKPTRHEVEFAAKTKSWYWQPVGMDISEDNLAAVILTYRAVYFFERQPQQEWLDALNSEPTRISLGNFENAEAVAFGDDARTVFVTGENKHSRLLRIDLEGVDTRSLSTILR